MNYIVAAGATVIQLIAILSWFGYSEAAFFADCNEEETTDLSSRPKLCATTGPGFAMGAFVPVALATILFFLVYPKRQIKRQ
jgi:hypothetical protein